MWQAVLKIDLLHWIVEPQLNGGWRHNYSSKTRLAGHAKEQPIYSLLSMNKSELICFASPKVAKASRVLPLSKEVSPKNFSIVNIALRLIYLQALNCLATHFLNELFLLFSNYCFRGLFVEHISWTTMCNYVNTLAMLNLITLCCAT